MIDTMVTLLEQLRWFELPLAQGRGTGFDPNQLFGFLILFFVVVWPIIRGALEAAAKKRREFERQQRSSGRAPARTEAGERRRAALEDLMRGLTDAEEPPPTPEVEAAPTPPPLPPKPRRSAEDVRDAGSLVGDPFDEQIMGRNLVARSDLAEVPSEDAIEHGFTPSQIGQAPDEATRARNAAARNRERFTSLDESSAAMAIDPGSSADAAAASRRALDRLQRRLTPWQQAFVMKEILGPPRHADPIDRRTF